VEYLVDDAVIQAKGLVKTFGGKVRALDGLTLTVPQGGIFALLGPNGAGKTTLIHIPAGVHQLGVRPHPDHARLATGLRANQPVTVTTNALRGLILGQGALP
jgi:ABC-type branched-subunit amino acid transport system ATPase component